MNCVTAAKQFSLMLYGELSFEDEELLQRHLDECEPCRTGLARVKNIHRAIDSQESGLDMPLLADCRRTLRVSVAALGPARKPGWFEGLGLRSFLKPAGAFALLAIGFAGARMIPPDNGNSVDTAQSVPVATRVRYVEPAGAPGQVQIVVEETRERTLSGATASEPIRKLLLAAARDGSDPGLRVESMDILNSNAGSTEVRRALIYALQHDSNAGVRLKALDGLKGSAGDPETQHALSKVLLVDDNAAVRTQAIDLLTQTREASMVGVLQEVMRKEDNSYVRLKCQKVLHEMNASAGTF